MKVITNFKPTNVIKVEGILKRNKNNVSHSAMLESLLQNVSGDQLPAAMAGMQFHLDLSAEEEEVSLQKYQYEKLLNQYKQGQLQTNLSNKVTIKELQKLRCSHERSVNFSSATTLHCYNDCESEASSPRLLRADDVTFSLGTGNVSLKETECRKGNHSS